MSLPDMFLGSQDRTSARWEADCRGEILERFATNVYGVTPTAPCEAVYEVVEEETVEDGILHQVLRATFTRGGKRCSFRSHIYRPAGEGSCPAVIMLNPFSQMAELQTPERMAHYFPYRLIAGRGYAAIRADVDELCPDDPERYTQGLLELYPRQGESGWGTIGAWAWAGSRLVDYLEGRADIDCGYLTVMGCSRAGKTALWCGAQDTRFAVVISNVSGCTGAAVARGKQGERIRDITGQFPHWICERYADYADKEEALPLDQHMLLALCAPRPLYVSSASNDDWAHPAKEFEACVAAGEVYRAYGLTGLTSEVFPAVNTPITGGHIAYHTREGDHGCRLYDWEQFLAFMEVHRG